MEDADLNDEDVTRLAAWPGLGSVRALGLMENPITEVGLRALRTSPHLSGPHSLRIYTTEGGRPRSDPSLG